MFWYVELMSNDDVNFPCIIGGKDHKLNFRKNIASTQMHHYSDHYVFKSIRTSM